VVVVANAFRDDLVRRGIAAEKIEVIRNGVDLAMFTPDVVRSDDDRKLLGAAPGETLVLYLGTHGISHGLDAVLVAAAALRDAPIHVALVGEGSRKDALVATAARRGLDNVTFLGGVPHAQVPGLVAAADICLVPLRDVPLFASFIPSKIFEYLGSGRAIVGAVVGESATILKEAGAVVVPPDDAAAMAVAIKELAADPARRAAMGARGRRYVEESFDRAEQARGYLGVLASIAAARAR
jgi:glycosyltransferase involved in cell wall biosynthesis